MPDCEAVIEHVPIETGLALPLTIVQTEVVEETKVTARPEDALAVNN